MRQLKSVRYFVVREFTAGCLPELDPITLYSVSDLRDHLRQVRDIFSDERYTVHTPVSEVVKLKPGESTRYIETDRFRIVEVEAVKAIERTHYPTRQANDFGGEYDYLTDSQDIQGIIDHHHAHIIGYCDLVDVSSVYVRVGDGEYLEVWICTSNRPHLADTSYALVFGEYVTSSPVTLPDESIKPHKTEDTTYNGWRNYPTWNVALWLSNDPVTDHDTRSLLDSCETVYEYADALKQYVDDMQELTQLPVTGMFADLLGFALRSVDWDEIAENFSDGHYDD